MGQYPGRYYYWLLAIFSIFLLSLNWLTHHDQSSTVPLLPEKIMKKQRKYLKKAGFEVEIQDSIYVDTTETDDSYQTDP